MGAIETYALYLAEWVLVKTLHGLFPALLCLDYYVQDVTASVNLYLIAVPCTISCAASSRAVNVPLPI